MSHRYRSFFSLFIIILLGAAFHCKTLNDFPSHSHAWAQADRYALSLGFVRNGLNFFLPETYVMNHQFPHQWEVPSESSITAVNFPVHDYIPAVFMKISGNTSPWIFRLYILLYSFLGLYALFKLSFLLTKSFLKSVLITILAATSPVFVYYQSSFLPTVPSLSNALIGIYFYAKFLQNGKNRSFNIGLAFLTLAALSRTTFAIPLIAVFCNELVRVYFKSTLLKPKVLPAVLSIAALVSYFLYNNYLRNTYGSNFLNHLMPASDFDHAVEIITHAWTTWKWQFFSKMHYLIFLVMGIAGLVYLWRKKRSAVQTSMFRFVVIYFIGCTGFAVLMLKQFSAHEYYFLDSFFIPVFILLLLLLSFFPKNKSRRAQILTGCVILGISLPLALNAVKSQKERRHTGHWDRTHATFENYRNADRFLDSLNIEQDAKILVIDAYAPNIPLLLMDRKGYVVMATTHKTIKNALNWNYDYITLQNGFFLSDVYANYPEILNKIKKLGSNGKITVCKQTEKPVDQDLMTFLGLDKKQPVLAETVSFENTPSENWQHISATDEVAFSGNRSGIMYSSEEFGITYKSKKLPQIEGQRRTLLVNMQLLSDTLNACELVVSITEDAKKAYYKTNDLASLPVTAGSWSRVELMFQLPGVRSTNYEFAVYLWNTGRNKLYVDDFSIELY